MAKENRKAETADRARVSDEPVPGMRLQCICSGHRGTIGHIAWSPCGRYIASPSSDQTVRIWNSINGECVATLGGSRMFRCVAWNSSGKMLAAGDDGGSIVVWAVNYEDGPILEASNALTGHAVYKYKISDNSFPITAIEWSTNESDVIGAVSQDAMCAIRNVSTGAKLATLRWTKIPEKSPAKVATTQQNKLKAKTITLLGNATIVAWPIVPPDQRMDTWDVAHEGRLLGANRTHNDDAIRTHNDIGWSPDGKRVVACLKGQPLFWNTNTWQPEFDISPRFDAYSAAWAPSGEVVAFGDKDLIRLWSCREGRELERIEGQSGRITSMHFSFDGGTLVSVSDSGTIRLWQVGSAVPLAVFLTDTKPVKVNEYIPSIRLPVIGDAFDIMMPMDRKKVHEAKTVSVPLSNKDRRRLSPSYSPLLSAN